MIRFANNETKPEVRDMWKTCFGDSDSFIDMYFAQKYKNENTLIYIEDGKVAASLQMLPYTITFCGEEIPCYYFSGLCTLPQYRRKGYMEKLTLEAFRVMQERSIPLAILIPAEDWLYGFYNRYGFEKVFDKDTDAIPLKDILDKYPNDLIQAYEAFDKLFRHKDFCVQKTFDDFKTIASDYIASDYPHKHNLAGMARIVDADRLLKVYARNNPDKSFMLKVFDSLIAQNNLLFINKDGETELDAEIKFLARMLFGYHTYEFKPKYKALFEEHHPIMNLMLE
ncbi:putative acetyltransferase [Dysgonomonas sp. PH5-45]|uniref:GNAT family N-acetyltransferase n=1 Tax=unclassified Dysgonomonas TaxID=2630389 RepID=UPI0024758A02|nr:MULTISPECIES: GNAT family N-acetyltransferase [unclassified Dysgonomonas]MDH6355584.1 putative acetyltransferase [Dysgonomonas sp. PH5-45]MDH6388506.1 putative acetyltransferase [Dysgonomonas sp. PH5-37]